MPSLSYYATYDETMAILRDIVARHELRVVPNRNDLADPDPPIYDAVTDELIEEIARRPTYYLLGSFTKQPLELVKQEDGPNSGKYFVLQWGGGPAIHMTAGRVSEVRGERIIVAAGLYHGKEYKNIETGQYEPASQELRSAFHAIVKTLKTHLAPHQLAKKIWISPGALALLQRGEAKIIARGVTHGPLR